MPSVTADELDVGTEIPDVKFVNQDGKTIHLADFRGKAVLVTFIYTRCPFPDFCPLLSHEFAAMDRELKKTPRDYERTHLMSISLDPAYDKPPVLRNTWADLHAGQAGRIPALGLCRHLAGGPETPRGGLQSDLY